MLSARVLRWVAAAGLAAMIAVAVGNDVASAQSIGQQARSDDLAALRQIDVPAAWPESKGSGVTVAVLDTGVERSAPDLAGQVTAGPGYTAGANPPGYVPPHLHGTYIGSHRRARQRSRPGAGHDRRRAAGRSCPSE